jgi:L-Ala-D/L-Glu epimerase
LFKHSASSLRLAVSSERWTLRESFAISREVFTHSQIISVTISDGVHFGRGECEPHESDPVRVCAVMSTICELERHIVNGMTRGALAEHLPAGPARNALDCALWDLEAKRAGRRVWELLSMPMHGSVPTAYTLGLDTPAAMASKARAFAQWPLLKIKLGGNDEVDIERVRAIREVRPDARLIVDANGGWTLPRLKELAPALKSFDVELIEQPLPADSDAELSSYRSPVPLCADESCMDRQSLQHVVGRYQCINIKLDKTGGLSEALHLVREARELGIGIMVGCMVGTSLAMAPALMVAQFAEFIDLDGPMLLTDDREHGLEFREGHVMLPSAKLWG